MGLDGGHEGIVFVGELLDFVIFFIDLLLYFFHLLAMGVPVFFESIFVFVELFLEDIFLIFDHFLSYFGCVGPAVGCLHPLLIHLY